MRIGQNPAKYVKEVAKPSRVTVAVLNYIPFVSGFYAELPGVLNACLESIRNSISTDLAYDLMVFDNGSCPEVVEYLTREKDAAHIQYLLLSEKNLGKGGAWNMILSGAPGEIIAYTDNDCLFSPGWLERSLQILETFPKVGMVTARPFRTNPEFYSGTVDWAQNTPDAILERGQFIPWETFRDFDLSLGQEEADIRKRYDSTEDVRLTYQGVQALIGASHWQFTARKDVLAQFLPFNMDRPMGQVKQLDQRMNAAGYLRLMPTEPLAMNLSNTLRGVSIKDQAAQKARPNRKHPVLDFPPVKKTLLSLYDAIFRWYYDRQ